MNNQTRDALVAEIKVWRTYERGPSLYMSPLDLEYGPLCRVFHTDETCDANVICCECPVKCYTNKGLCKETPFDNALQAYKTALDDEDSLPQFREAVGEMATFLEAVLAWTEKVAVSDGNEHD